LLFDLDGNPRIADGNGDELATVDMGAYERPGTASTVATGPADAKDGLAFFVEHEQRSLAFHYVLPADSNVQLTIYDVRGRQVRKLAGERQSRGEHRIRWTETGEKGRRVASGIYFARLRSGSSVESLKFVLLR
jgi:flagellar hook assembly protein FlgD